MNCYECGWPNIARTRDGQRRCPRCAAVEPAGRSTTEPAEQPSGVVKAYTGFFAVVGLLFPFLVPIIIKLSLIYS